MLQDENAIPTAVVAHLGPVPSRFSLSQNYPNPFNPTTTIEYHLAKAGHIRLNIYNVLGQLIETFVDEHQQPGYYSVKWNATDNPSGVYFYQIQAGGLVESRRMILLK